MILEEGAFRKLDLDTNGAVTLDKWQDFDTNVEAKENFSTPGENALQVNPAEFLTEAPKHAQPYSVFGGSDQTKNNDFSWDGQEFQSQGLRLFTNRF